MKLTLLEMVQNILSDMNSFNVNNIFEHQESRQVVDIIQTTYNHISAYRYWPAHKKPIKLESGAHSGVILSPTLVIPSKMVDLEDLYYNSTKLRYVDINTFLERMMTIKPDSDGVEEYELDNITFKCKNDRDPTTFTLLPVNDGTELVTYIICDSYDKSVDDSLMPSKSVALGTSMPEFRKENTFIPDMPEEAFPYLLAESKARAFISIKGVDNPAATADAARLRSRLAVEKGVIQSRDTYPNYGRK